ncbi:hypothetical protein [Urbifossiella limnaea]|uniref:Uncharacterized protein n=1 Tax=Urbifossiella limnaea TaxID=2528023 RepID=A0A517XST1_9BACT|nr:hypothetical protein [Urbifossiella limnaea]QDU20553.1 hypothetical protein ETAA1_25080 [Urbifossiella limnaea]
MPLDPHAAVKRAARELLGNLAELTDPPRLRVTDASGQLACMILVWGTAQGMPPAAVERRTATGGRAECRSDILAVIGASGRALTHKQLVRALREAGTPHGPGTVMKALAELTRMGELVNPKDKKGYRLASWPTPGTPPLF